MNKDKYVEYSELSGRKQYAVIVNAIGADTFRSNRVLNEMLRDELRDKYGIIPDEIKYDYSYLDINYYPFLFSTQLFLTREILNSLRKKYTRQSDFVTKEVLDIVARRELSVTIKSAIEPSGDAHYYPVFEYDDMPEYYSNVVTDVMSELNLPYWHASRIVTNIVEDLKEKYRKICNDLNHFASIFIRARVNDAIIKAKNYLYNPHSTMVEKIEKEQ